VDESSVLETTAEISVAFAGFIGIFLVLATRDGRFQPGEAWGIRLIVICSVAPVFAAAVPLILHAFGISGALLWRISSSAIGLSGVAIAPYMARQLRVLPPGEGRSLNPMFWLAVVAVLGCLANALGWPWPPSGGLYLVTVWSVVGIAAGNFVQLIFSKVL
jgi:hypothetical protein